MSVLVVAEQKNGKMAKASLGALRAGAELAEKLGVSAGALFLGPGAAQAAQAVTTSGVAHLWALESPALDVYADESYAAAVTDVARRQAAQAVVGAASAQGKAMLPHVAVALEAGMASEVIAITERRTFIRTMYAGTVNAEVEITTPIAVLSVRTTSFAALALDKPAIPVERLHSSVPLAVPGKRVLAFEERSSSRPLLTDAAIVVAAGRGLRTAENLVWVERLADALGAAIGATRAIVDAGWIANAYQVGQTGKVVAPDLYIALGLSGAPQHLAGMKDAKVIVAINEDEEAPIFSVADYGLVGDLAEILPEWLEAWRTYKNA